MLKKEPIDKDYISLIKGSFKPKNFNKEYKNFSKGGLQHLYYYNFYTQYKEITHYRKGYLKNLYRNILYLELKDILEEILIDLNIPYLFYKGIENIKYYEDIGIRDICDIDLMIPFEKKDLFIKSLKKLNYSYRYSFYKNYFQFKNQIHLDIELKNNRLNLDLHFYPVQKIKYPIDINIFFKKRVEIDIYIIFLELISEFLNSGKKINDLYYLIKKNRVNWSYIFQIGKQFKTLRAIYVIIYYLNRYFNFNIPYPKISLFERKILENTPFFENKRLNQLFLYHLNFDKFTHFLNFLYKKTIDTINKGDIKGEINKFFYRKYK